MMALLKRVECFLSCASHESLAHSVVEKHKFPCSPQNLPLTLSLGCFPCWLGLLFEVCIV